MKIKLKKQIVFFFYFLLIAAGTVLFFSFTIKNYYQHQSGKIFIKIDYSKGHHFVNESVVEEITFSPKYQIQPLKNFQLHTLEQKLEAYPHIRNAEIYFNVDGNLFIEVEQINPIGRIFNQKQESFYIDEEGKLSPLSDRYVARVPVVNGNIISSGYLPYHKSINEIIRGDSTMQNIQLKEIYDMALYLNKHPFWQKQIQQIYVNKDFEYELITRIGNHRIVMGKPYPIAKKMERLMVLYQKAFPIVGWDRYREINLKYSNQIICR